MQKKLESEPIRRTTPSRKRVSAFDRTVKLKATKQPRCLKLEPIGNQPRFTALVPNPISIPLLSSQLFFFFFSLSFFTLISYPPIHSFMSVTGIQGQLLEVTVVGCNKLKDTEWISRQDPYVCLEYASTKFRTRTCTDGGKNPTFQEKFVFTLIEGLREINVIVWNSNTLTFDDYIGSGRVQLQKVLAQGFDDTAWPLQSKSGRHAGEVRLILHYPNANKSAHGQHGFAPSAPPYAPSAPAMPYTSQPSPATAYPLSGGYPPPPTAYHGYPNPPTTYPSSPSPYPLPPQSTSYPPQPGAYPPPPHSSAYPPPPSMYPPPPSVYPPAPYPPAPYPPPQASPFYPGSYPGSYRPY